VIIFVCSWLREAGFHLTAARKDTECRLCGSGTCFVTSASIHPRFLLRVTETMPKEDSKRNLLRRTYLTGLDVHKLQVHICYCKPKRIKDKTAQTQILFFLYFVKCRNRDSSATGYRLDGKGRFPARARNCSLQSVPTGSGARPASCPGSKAAGREADHSPPSSADVKNGGAIPPLPHMSSWHGA
jgi:hypothetical protein